MTLPLLLTLFAAPADYPFAVKVHGSGPAIIFIPGLGCSGDVWDGAVAHYSKTHQCHVLTLAGFAGEKPRGGAFLDPVRDGIVRYIKDKNLAKPAIVGHSIGGFLAYDLGIAAPDAVGKLVAVDGLPFLAAVANETATEAKAAIVAATMKKAMSEATRENFLKQQANTLALWVPDEAKRKPVSAWGEASDQATVATAMSEMFARDLREKAAAIKSPLLLIAAPQAFGTVTLADAEKRYRAQVAKIPTHTVAVAKNSRHFVMIDEPEWLWQQIDTFLSQK